MTEQRTDVALRRPLEPDAVRSPTTRSRPESGEHIVVDVRSDEAYLDLAPLNPGRLLTVTEQAGLLVAPKWQLGIKRAIDLIGAAVALLLLSPVIIATALAVKLSSPGPVFFVQSRMGKNGQEFNFLKFRSMRVGAADDRDDLLDLNEMTGPVFKIREDPRITPIGALLRRTSLDELPQLWHVICGHMSLVGPRPLPTCEAQACSDYESQRLLAKPGITCIWQVSGRSELDFATWVRMDIRYIERWSLWLDMKLLLKTIPAVVSGVGAY